MYRHLETVEGFDVNMELMKSLRASLDGLHAYETANIPARPKGTTLSSWPWSQYDNILVAQEDETECKRLDDERMEYQERWLANMHKLLTTEEHAAREKAGESAEESRAGCVLDRSEGAKTRKEAQQDELVNPELAEAPDTTIEEAVSSKICGGISEQDGDNPDKGALDDELPLKCPKCDETFARHAELDIHAMAHMGLDADSTSGPCSVVGRDQTTLGAYILAAHSVDQDPDIECE